VKVGLTIKIDTEFGFWEFCWNKIKYFVTIRIQLAWSVGPGHERYFGRLVFIFFWRLI